MSENVEPLSDGVSGLGDVLEIYSFHDARGETHVSKLLRKRALGRKLFAEVLKRGGAVAPRLRLQSETPDPRLVVAESQKRPSTIHSTSCGSSERTGSASQLARSLSLGQTDPYSDEGHFFLGGEFR